MQNGSTLISLIAVLTFLLPKQIHEFFKGEMQLTCDLVTRRITNCFKGLCVHVVASSADEKQELFKGLSIGRHESVL